MHIAQIAPLAESVPAKLYGGTERVVHWLTEELIAQGHQVTLFASGDSKTRATLVPSIAHALRLARPRHDDGLDHPPWRLRNVSALSIASLAMQWKLSPMDLESRRRWEAYTMLQRIVDLARKFRSARSLISQCPEHHGSFADKKKARLNCIRHLLTQVPYKEIQRQPIKLPPRVHNAEYQRRPVPSELYIPEEY